MTNEQGAIVTMMQQYWPRINAYPDAVTYFAACAEHVALHADACGVVITVHLKPENPLAMRNFKPVVEAREKR